MIYNVLHVQNPNHLLSKTIAISNVYYMISFLSVYSVSVIFQSQRRPFVEYIENVLDVACKVNEFGSTCAQTLVTLARTSSLFVS